MKMQTLFLTATLMTLLPALGSRADVPEDPAESEVEVSHFSHGFRLGYMVIFDHNCAASEDEACEDLQGHPDIGLVSPHLFLMGYELTQRIEGGAGLNVLFVENLTVGGIEQSLFLPSLNVMIGVEIQSVVQFAFGISMLPPIIDSWVHLLLAVGYTPEVGAFQVPVHVFFMPDATGQHRFGVTVGVNW